MKHTLLLSALTALLLTALASAQEHHNAPPAGGAHSAPGPRDMVGTVKVVKDNAGAVVSVALNNGKVDIAVVDGAKNAELIAFDGKKVKVNGVPSSKDHKYSITLTAGVKIEEVKDHAPAPGTNHQAPAPAPHHQ